MKAIKNLIVFSLFTGILFAAHSTFTNGKGAAIGLGVGLGTAAIVGSSVAASNAARERDYYRYQMERDRAHELAERRRHRERMAAIRASRGRYPVQNPYPAQEGQYVDPNYYGGATTIYVEE